MSCRSCIERCTPDGCGSKCPRCRKVFEVDIKDLVTFQMPQTKRLWCRDCDAEARAACFDEHALCGLGRVRQELAAQVEPLLAGCAASLRRLAEDVRAEEVVLQQWRESLAGGRQEPTAIRAVEAAARAHPLHGLQGGDGEVQEGGLLLRALAALRRQEELPGKEELRAREAAVDAKIAALEEKLAGLGLKDGTLDEKLDKLVALNEREAADGEDAAASVGKKAMKSSGLEKRVASVEAREAAVEKREADVEKREAALKKSVADVEKRGAALKKSEADVEKRGAALKKSEADVEKKEAAVKKREAEIEKRGEALKKSEAAVGKLQAELEKKETGASDKEVDLEIREDVVGRRETTVEEREAAVDTREAAVRTKELAVQAREDAVQEREADVQEKDAALEERETAIEGREAALQEEAALVKTGGSAHGENSQGRDAGARGRDRAATWQERSAGAGEDDDAAQRQERSAGAGEEEDTAQQQRRHRQTAKRGARAAHNGSKARRSRESPPLAHSSAVTESSSALLNSTQWTTCSESGSSTGVGSPPPVWKPRYVAAKKNAAPFIPSSPSGSSDDDDDGAGGRQPARGGGTPRSLAREQQRFVAVRKKATAVESSDDSDASSSGVPRSDAAVASEADCPLSDDELPDIDISLTAPPSLDSLPEALLLRVLSLVPLWWPKPQPDEPAAAAVTSPSQKGNKCVVPGLLSLRLVCRRWSRAVLSPDVWRHRELDLDAHPAGLLRLAPAVSKVSATTWKADAILQALELSACKVRSLELRVVASTAASAILKRTLDKLRPSLRELDLTVLFNHHQNSAGRLMPLVDGPLPALRALRLGQQRDLTGHHGPLNFPFRHLRAQLVSLAFGDNVHADTARSLLAANAETLREVGCGRNADLVPLVAEHALLVRTVSLQGPAVAAAPHLRTLEDLHTLKVAPESEEQSSAVAELLAASPLTQTPTPSEVHVRLQSLDQLRHWNERLDMRRVSVLDVSLDSGELQQLPMFALILPAVLALTVDLGGGDAAWTKFKAAWSYSTAPKLARLHLVNAKGCAYSGWVKELAAKRRSLVICVDD